MNKVIPLLSFGIGLMCLGFYWHFYNDVLTLHLAPYFLHSYTAFGVAYTHDKYFDFMYMIWRLIPWIFVIIGIVLLIAAGTSSHSDSSSGVSE
jgi:hypothetical protein